MQYLKQISYSESTSRIPLNAFYVDFAQYLVDNAGKETSFNFVSPNFISSEGSAFAVISLLALPLYSASHEYKTNEGRGVNIVASGNLVLFKKAVKETE
jgi:hypothetical protein